jgi:hypothetical protein
MRAAEAVGMHTIDHAAPPFGGADARAQVPVIDLDQLALVTGAGFTDAAGRVLNTVGHDAWNGSAIGTTVGAVGGGIAGGVAGAGAGGVGAVPGALAGAWTGAKAGGLAGTIVGGAYGLGRGLGHEAGWW